MGDMTVDELKDKKLWFLWSAKPGRNGKVTKVPFAANGGATGTDDAHKGTWVSFDDAESARFYSKEPMSQNATDSIEIYCLLCGAVLRQMAQNHDANKLGLYTCDRCRQ